MSSESTIARFLNKSNWWTPGASYNGTACLVWRGSRNRRGHPTISTYVDGIASATTPRQIGYLLGHGRPANGRIKMLCGLENCCRPSHMQRNN
jgi:hypothetical protein